MNIQSSMPGVTPRPIMYFTLSIKRFLNSYIEAVLFNFFFRAHWAIKKFTENSCPKFGDFRVSPDFLECLFPGFYSYQILCQQHSQE